ncbi:Mechanosensitive ion channel [Chitinophaga costaii]|uniref:Mechanosensitive ion channel n=1 Tax=Chitinophaga costaii TaxID=1335309 RepID=A0A1C4G2E9_9BACT|nr:mechanosensitive ion channel [Chitinophaga costaii]PUZ19783.1 mechanosensitive ion channel protein MscS [Chitinophaga costaii]SCC62367.1 Mechanosensitive ion channel [Chitinophaga costaii]
MFLLNEYESWSRIIFDKLNGWRVMLFKMLPNLVIAIIILVVTHFVARLLRKITYRLVHGIAHSAALSSLFSSMAYICVMFIGLFMALQVLQLEKTVSSLLAGAGIIGLALGFAFQDLTANFISGIYIGLKKPFDVGHIIETNGFIGHVEDIQLRSTILRTFDGLYLNIPNKEIFQKPIINHTLSTHAKIEINVVVPLAKNDPDKIIDLLQNALKDETRLSGEKPPEVVFTDIEGGNLKLQINLWTNHPAIAATRLLRHDVVTKVTKVLKENDLL